MVFQRITVNPKICGGKPVIRGLRFPVSRLLGRDTGDSHLFCCPSKRFGLLHRLLADVPVQGRLGDHAHLSAEEVLKVHEETAEVEETPAGLQIDEKIDVPGL